MKKDLENKKVPIYNISNNIYKTPIESTIISDEKMVKLMKLISCAIEEWAKEYQLENLPKKIIFEQALDAMLFIEASMNNKN